MRGTNNRALAMPRLSLLKAFLCLGLLSGTFDALSASAWAEPTKITLWRHTGDLQPEMDTFASFVKDFNASQQAWNVTEQDLPQQSYEKSINAAALAGKLPCVIDVDGPLIPNFAWAGHLLSLDKYLTDSVRTDMLASTVGRYNGHIYGVGQFEASLAIWARKSILEKYKIRIPKGVDDPWTKDEFDAALTTLKQSGEFKTVIDMFSFYTHEWLPYAYSPWLQSFGGDLIDRSTYLTADGKLNGPQALAWGKWWQNLFQTGLADPKAPDDQAFIQGRAALAWIGNWYYPTLKKAWGDDLIYLPPPNMGKSPVVGGGSWQWAITKGCANPDGAWAFLDFLLKPESIAKMSNVTGLIPSRHAAVALTPLYGEGGALKDIVNISASFAVVRPPTPAYGTIREKFAEAAGAIANGADVQNTLDDLVQVIDSDIKDHQGYGFK